MEWAALGARILLVLVFATAGVTKLSDQSGSRKALLDFHVPARLVRRLGMILPLGELGTAAALLFQPSARFGAIAAGALLALFIAGIASAMARGEAPDCNCFGQISSSPVGPRTLIRNMSLAALALVVAIYGPGRDLAGWTGSRSAAELVAVVLGGVASALAITVWKLRGDSVRLGDLLAKAQASLALFPPGLPVGAPAPEFALVSTTGEAVSLQSLLGRRRPIALVFVSPSCAPCRLMAPDLAGWQRTLSDRMSIVLVAAGPAEETRVFAEHHGLTDVVIQNEAEVFQAYRATASPSIVVVNPDGLIASRIRSSQGIVEAVVRHALRTTGDSEADASAADSTPTEELLNVRRWSSRGAAV
jgi:peroxiredoxin/uncharacterized membrane protein YphA (DoxX/SURF4 family)